MKWYVNNRSPEIAQQLTAATSIGLEHKPGGMIDK